MASLLSFLVVGCRQGQRGPEHILGKEEKVSKATSLDDSGASHNVKNQNLSFQGGELNALHALHPKITFFQNLPIICFTVATPPIDFTFSASRPSGSGGSFETAGAKRSRILEPNGTDAGAMEVEPFPTVAPKPIMNFCEKLMNPSGIGVHKEDLVVMEEDKLTIEDDDFEVSEGTRGPCIRFCTKVKERLYHP
ncbi:unnamed protein product [Prunus armeniaca]|uniref:Uncharacterized protein n=1 Tax=Prunus armeniaca TaxID=36596 RepID=A0A6J5VFG2_PRUAR|nr:unnamed protein product [Prunus armeniaca]